MALGTQQLPVQQHHKVLATQQQQHRAIAPAPAAANAGRLFMPYTKPACARTSPGTTLDSNSPSVVRRNARERNRVKQVNNGFLNLRQHIPPAIIADLSNGRRGGTGPGANKKLSKVDTLRMALEYIRLLQQVIDDVDHSDASSVSSCNSRCSSAVSPTSANVGSLSTEHFEALYQQMQQPLQHQQQQQSLYAFSFHEQQQQLISPSSSTTCSTSSDAEFSGSPTSSSCYHHHQPTAEIPVLKHEAYAYDESPSDAAADEDLLDYIALWQEDL